MPKRGEQDRTAGSPGGEQTTGCTDVAELLPFYLNRSLEEEGTRRVEVHLATCAACRQEERDTRTAWALHEGHLPVELLLDFALAQPMSSGRLAVVEIHLAVCERCSEEVATVRQTTPEEHAEPALRRLQPALAPFRRDRARLRTLAWAASLAAVVASGGWIWTWQQLADERARSSAPTARPNLSVVELLPATQPLLRQGSTGPQAAANRVEPRAALFSPSATRPPASWWLSIWSSFNIRPQELANAPKTRSLRFGFCGASFSLMARERRPLRPGV